MKYIFPDKLLNFLLVLFIFTTFFEGAFSIDSPKSISEFAIGIISLVGAIGVVSFGYRSLRGQISSANTLKQRHYMLAALFAITGLVRLIKFVAGYENYANLLSFVAMVAFFITAVAIYLNAKNAKNQQTDTD